MTKKLKKSLATLLAMSMILSMMSTAAFANEPENEELETQPTVCEICVQDPCICEKDEGEPQVCEICGKVLAECEGHEDQTDPADTSEENEEEEEEQPEENLCEHEWNEGETVEGGTKYTCALCGETHVLADEDNSFGTDTLEETVEENGGIDWTANEITIMTVDELIEFAEQVNGGTTFQGKTVTLGDDIDLSNEAWTPIGSNSKPFEGTFDGGDHTISNLNVTGDEYVGLFGYIGGNAGAHDLPEIKNLTVENVTVSATGNNVGGVVGNAFVAKVTNVHVMGTVDIEGRGYVGGIVGHGYVKVDNCSVEAGGTIKSNFWCVGGIIGYGGEGFTAVTDTAVDGGTEGLTITSAAGAVAGIIGRAEDNNGSQPCSGSGLSVRNVNISTFTGAYGDGYADNGLAYFFGGDVSTGKLTGALEAENVTVVTSTGASPTISDIVAEINGKYYASLQAAIDAAEDGDVVTLVNDTEEKVTVSSGDIVLDLNGKQIANKDTEGDGFFGAITVTGGKLTVDDTSAEKTGKVLGGCFAVVVKDGLLTVNNGSFGYSDESFVGWGKPWNEPLFVGGGSAVINDGFFFGGTLEYYYYYPDAAEGSLLVNGGRFDALPLYIAANQGAPIWAPNADGYVVAYKTYGDFAADNAASFTYDSGENVLQMTGAYNKSATQTDPLSGFFINGDVILDLNGQTWTMENANLIVVNENTTLTVRDSAGNGMIENKTEVVIETLGTLNIEGGTLSTAQTDKNVIAANGNCTINITGGKLEGKQYGIISKEVTAGREDRIINISGGEFSTDRGFFNRAYNENGAAKVSVSGGTFKVRPEEQYIATGLETKENGDGTFSVVIPDGMVAQIVGGGAYATLAEAIDAAQSGDTVMLLKDVTIDSDNTSDNSSAIEIPAGVTLDGAGHTITAGTFAQTLSQNKGTHMLGVGTTGVTIKNLTVDMNRVDNSRHALNVYGAAASATLENVTLKNARTAGMVVNGATVIATELKTENNGWGGVNVDKNGTFELVSGTLAEANKIWADDAGSTATVPEGWNWVEIGGRKVYSDALSLTLSRTTLSMTVGYTTSSPATLTIDGVPEGVTVIWSTNNETVATVADGVVTPRAAGTATITVTVGSMEAECVVSVRNTTAPFTPDTDDEDLGDEDTPLSDRPWMFVDVKEGDYFYDAVKRLFDKGIVGGTTETTYEPYADATRGMVAQILYGMAGSPDVTGLEMPFSDVKESDFYYNAVIWAYANKVIGGYPDGTFQGERTISREELAAVLHQYGVEKLGLADTKGDLSGFIDAAEISDWAVEHMKWAVGMEIMHGDDAKKLMPVDNTIRADMTIMLNNLDMKVSDEK